MIKKFNTKIILEYFLMFILAILVFAGFVYLENFNRHYSFVVNNKNELNLQSVNVLNQVKHENAIVFEVYTHKESPVAKKIKQFMRPYLRESENLNVQFLDPITHPNEVKLNAVNIQGEIVLRFKNLDSVKRVNITELSESSIINGILSLLNQKDEWLVVAEGFGMPTIADESEQGLSNMLIHLKKIGFQVARMPLNSAVVLPENVKAIIIPAPSDELSIKIAEWLKAQSDKGIGIWWLNDVGIKSQNNLELVFDVLSSGKLRLKNDHYTSYISSFEKHPITEEFNQPIYIAQAREIIADTFTPLFLNSEYRAFAVAKQFKKSRMIITGDSDFIRNQYINIAANKSMAVRIIDWLLINDERVNIPVNISKNTQLLLSQNKLIGLSLFFLIIVPLIFLVIAFFQWRKNHEK